jgi:heme oxygenase
MTMSRSFGYPKPAVSGAIAADRVPVRSYLRAATSDLHAEVDARMSAVMARAENGYREFLIRSAAALVPLERALETAGIETVLTDWPERARAASLRLDLADLGAPIPEQAAPASMPGLEGEAFQFGVLYVLEGSRLGARYITRGIDASLPSRYIRHGEGQPLWPTFLQHLETSAAREHLDDALRGACAAFQAFGDAATSEDQAEVV